ncbi:hypothetical protein CPC08DRAFT_769065 [Agrocybe pediades]|nr:hypothetical protein CPC08DRAFT_769065 [Agrocybe pediades]
MSGATPKSEELLSLPPCSIGELYDYSQGLSGFPKPRMRHIGMTVLPTLPPRPDVDRLRSFRSEDTAILSLQLDRLDKYDHLSAALDLPNLEELKVTTSPDKQSSEDNRNVEPYRTPIYVAELIHLIAKRPHLRFISINMDMLRIARTIRNDLKTELALLEFVNNHYVPTLTRYLTGGRRIQVHIE